MPYIGYLPIMPRETRAPSVHRPAAPYPSASTNDSRRSASTWSEAEDDDLVKARAGGMNWDQIHRKYFPNKSANACRKRHERILATKASEQWKDGSNFASMARAYNKRKMEFWKSVAADLGLPEREWTTIETRCMEKGHKALSAVERRPQRESDGPAGDQSYDESGNSDHASDSGIGLGSDTEREVGNVTPHAGLLAVQPADSVEERQTHHMSQHPRTASYHSAIDHHRSRSLPQIQPHFQPPLYQPPPPVQRSYAPGPVTMAPPPSGYTTHAQPAYHRGSPDSQTSYTPRAQAQTTYRRASPDSQNGRGGFSIQAVLSTD